MAPNLNLPQRPASTPADLNKYSPPAAPAESSVTPVAEAGLSRSGDQGLQRIPYVPGWQPEWVRFVQTRAEMGENSHGQLRPTYTFDQITIMMHGEFGPETHGLTAAIVMEAWRDHIRPVLPEHRNENPPMHQPDLSGPPGMPAGGSNEESQSGHGYQYGVPNHNLGNNHRAAPPNVHHSVPDGQPSRHENYEGHHLGANNERPQAVFDGAPRNPPITNQPLPSLRSLNLLPPGWHRDQANLHTMPPDMGHGVSPSETGHSASRIPAPSNASAAVPGEVTRARPRRYIPPLEPSVSTEHGPLLQYWMYQGLQGEATRQWRANR